ncbi:hypothetical protein ACE3MZ_07905 [Paenibacillus sp. WLX1005]|uniref:hypothetical protein n=1 Tax=Paenibacillus sp. WLX1005 TaxID=3243766 RepID=UPI0039841A2A
MKYRLLALVIALFLYAFVHYNAAHAAGEELSSQQTISTEKTDTNSNDQLNRSVEDTRNAINEESGISERALLQRTTASLVGTVTDTVKSVTDTTTQAASEVTSQASSAVADKGSNLGNTVGNTAGIVGNVTGVTEDLVKETEKLVTGEPTDITGALSSAVDQTVKDTVDTAAGAVSGTTATVTETVQSTVSTVDHVVNATTTTATDVVTEVVDTANDVVTHVPTVVTEVVKPLPTIPNPTPSVPVITIPPVVTPQPEPEHTTNPEAEADPTSSTSSRNHTATKPTGTQTPDDHSASAIHPQSPIQPQPDSASPIIPSSDAIVPETHPTNANPNPLSNNIQTASEATRIADEQEAQQTGNPSGNVPIWNWQSWMNTQDIGVDEHHTDRTSLQTVDTNDTSAGAAIPFAPSGLPLVPDYSTDALAVMNVANVGTSSAQLVSTGGNAGSNSAALLLDTMNDRQRNAPIVIHYTRSERGSSQWMNAPPGQPPQHSLYFNGQQSY